MAWNLSLLIAFAAIALASPSQEDTVIVDVNGKGVQKFEANQTQLGFSNTKIFYTLADRSVVFVVQIDNKCTDFRASGVVYQFAENVTADELSQWVNNQHSDGLFPDVPEPVGSHKLPADSIKTVSSKLLGQEKGGPDGKSYNKYSVEFEAVEKSLTKTLTLAAFKNSATVYIEPSAAMKTAALEILKGRKLLVGSPSTDGVTWEGIENVGEFKGGATRVGMNYPMANFEKGVGDFLAVIELEAPLTPEQVDAYAEFAKKHPAETAPVLIIEYPKEKPKDQATVKGRVIGVGNYPTGRPQNFNDADLKAQPFFWFGDENDE